MSLICLDNIQIPLLVIDALRVCRETSNGTTQNIGDISIRKRLRMCSFTVPLALPLRLLLLIDLILCHYFMGFVHKN
jgi:hypothetical protein